MVDEGLTPEAAQAEYVKLVGELKTKYGFRDEADWKPAEKEKIEAAKAKAGK